MNVRQCPGLSALGEHLSGSSWEDVVTYWADVFQFGMHSGRIRQEGGRGSEKDSEICMCVVVHACVGRCQQGDQPSLEIVSDLWEGGEGTKRGSLVTDTRVQRGGHARSGSLPQTRSRRCGGNQRTIAIDINLTIVALTISYVSLFHLILSPKFLAYLHYILSPSPEAHLQT